MTRAHRGRPSNVFLPLAYIGANIYRTLQNVGLITAKSLPTIRRCALLANAVMIATAEGSRQDRRNKTISNAKGNHGDCRTKARK